MSGLVGVFSLFQQVKGRKVGSIEFVMSEDARSDVFTVPLELRPFHNRMVYMLRAGAELAGYNGTLSKASSPPL